MDDSQAELDRGLMKAARAGRSAKVREFLAAGADPLAIGEHGGSALNWAVRCMDLECFEALAPVSDVHGQGLMRANALMAGAIEWGRVAPGSKRSVDAERMVKDLWRRMGSEPDAHGWTPLMSAACARAVGLASAGEFQEAASGGAALARDIHGRTALMIAADIGSRDALRALVAVSDIWAVDDEGRGAFERAIHHGVGLCSEFDEALGQADLDAPGRREALAGALKSAAAGGDARSVAALLRWTPADVPDGQSSPLMMAAFSNCAQSAALLLASGARPGAVDESGLDALQWAQGRDSVEVVQLVRPGAMAERARREIADGLPQADGSGAAGSARRPRI